MKNILSPLLLLLAFADMAFCQEKMEINGAIILKNSEDPSPESGTIRWTGTDFEGWNGQRWVSLTGYATVGTVTDIDGNTYPTTRIGNQEWMIENLRVSKYNDNTVIDQITDNATWSGLLTGAWCWFNNDNGNEMPYGKLYNWYAVNTGMLCPTDWHVPSDAEWTTLTDYLGGVGIAGGKMKEVGTTHWNSPNFGATNESGFKGLPGGFRNSDGSFAFLGNFGIWLSSTESSSTENWHCSLNFGSASADQNSLEKSLGYSVRCVKD